MFEGINPATQELIVNEFPSRLGWRLSEYGQILLKDEVLGYETSVPRLYYGSQPDARLLNGWAGILPLVMTRSTPNYQRLIHLQRTIKLPDERKLSLEELIERFRDKVAIGSNIESNLIPMVDCVLFLPLRPDGPTYFGGNIDVGHRRGAQVVIDRGSTGKIWVKSEDGPAPLPIASISPDKSEIQVFTVEGVLNGGELRGNPQALWDNSVTLFTMVSDLIKVECYPPSNDFWNQPLLEVKNGAPMEMRINVGRMGSSANTGVNVQSGAVPKGLKYPLLMNVVPCVIDPQIDQSDAIKQLSTNLVSQNA